MDSADIEFGEDGAVSISFGQDLQDRLAQTPEVKAALDKQREVEARKTEEQGEDDEGKPKDRFL